LRINPENHKAWDNLGVCYDALNQDADALKSFFKALDIVMKKYPSYDWAHANLADFFLRRDQNEKAFQLAIEAAKRNPSSPRNCFLTAKALVRLEKHDISVRWLERAVELDPNYAEALYVLAQTYRKLGRAKEAAATLARFEEVSKNQTRRR
jgi:tetratricopeptide (TPR) repeat protein